MKARFVLLLVLFLLWMGLTYPPTLEEVVAGAAAALLISLLAGPVTAAYGEIKVSPRALFYWIGYLFVFLRELVKANLDVARRVISPRLPIRPGIVRVETKLKSSLGRLLLANSITLTPGTITVESRGSSFYIHWINVEEGTAEERSQKIVSTFERYLEVTCG